MSNSNLERENDHCSLGELFKEAQSLKPEANSYADAIVAAQRKLENLASAAGLSIENLLIEAESSPSHKESYLHALALQRQINFYKSQIK